MSKWTSAISVTFNDNDGKVGWTSHPTSAYDVLRHHKIFGRWRSRWIFFKRFWRAMIWLERYASDSSLQNKTDMKNSKLWVFKPEIPE